MKVHDKDDWDAFGQAMAFTNATGMDNQFMGYYDMAGGSKEKTKTKTPKPETKTDKKLAWIIAGVVIVFLVIYAVIYIINAFS